MAEIDFWDYVNVGKPDECWPYKYALPGNYGHYYIKNEHAEEYAHLINGKRTTVAHRLAWILTNGPIEDGLFACHKCDNPPCCNPNHLFLGTNSDNLKDCFRKGRHPLGTIEGAHAIMVKWERGRVEYHEENGNTEEAVYWRKYLDKHVALGWERP